MGSMRCCICVHPMAVFDAASCMSLFLIPLY